MRFSLNCAFLSCLFCVFCVFFVGGRSVDGVPEPNGLLLLAMAYNVTFLCFYFVIRFHAKLSNHKVAIVDSKGISPSSESQHQSLISLSIRAELSMSCFHSSVLILYSRTSQPSIRTASPLWYLSL